MFAAAIHSRTTQAGLIALPLVLALTLSSSRTASAQMDLPAIPDPAPVTLVPATTALLLLDFGTSNCSTRPVCVASLPAVSTLADQARAVGVPVVHAVLAAPMVPELTALPDEPTVMSGPDKFFRTELDQILKDRGIETTIMVGTAANGAVMYTAFGATQRGYTVVVAEDGISSATDFATFLTRWQVLNQPGGNNPENKPLEKGRITLSRTDLITFQP
jgi:nicotinamidase-related amidase